MSNLSASSTVSRRDNFAISTLLHLQNPHPARKSVCDLPPTSSEVISDVIPGLKAFISAPIQSPKLLEMNRNAWYLFLSEGGDCTIANTFCSTWIDASCQVERSIQKLEEKAIWHLEADPAGLWDLLSCLCPGPQGARWMSVLQVGFTLGLGVLLKPVSINCYKRNIKVIRSESLSVTDRRNSWKIFPGRWCSGRYW